MWARRRRGSADSRAAARRARRTAGSPPCAGRACRRERINTAIHIYRHATCASGRCAMCGQPARCGLSLRSLRVPFSLRPVASRSFRSAPFRSARSVPLAPFPVASAASAARGGVGPPSAPVFPCHLPTPRSVCSRLCSPLLLSARSQLAIVCSPIARSSCPLAIACSPSIARYRCPVRRCPVANAPAANAPFAVLRSPVPGSPSLVRRCSVAVACSPLCFSSCPRVLQLLPSGAQRTCERRGGSAQDYRTRRGPRA